MADEVSCWAIPNDPLAFSKQNRAFFGDESPRRCVLVLLTVVLPAAKLSPSQVVARRRMRRPDKLANRCG
jgi:hypothetical protein